MNLLNTLAPWTPLIVVVAIFAGALTAMHLLAPRNGTRS